MGSSVKELFNEIGIKKDSSIWIASDAPVTGEGFLV